MDIAVMGRNAMTVSTFAHGITKRTRSQNAMGSGGGSNLTKQAPNALLRVGFNGNSEDSCI